MEFVEQKAYAEAKSDSSRTPGSLDATPETDCKSTTKEGVGYEVKDGGAQFASGHEMMDPTCETGTDLPTVTSAPTSDGSPGDFSAGNTGKTSDVATTETAASAQTGTEASVKKMVESSHKGTGLDSCKNVQEATLSSQEGAPKCCTEMDAVTRAQQTPSSSVNDGSNDSSLKCVAKSAGMQDPTVTTFSDASHAEGEIGVKLSKQENLNVELALGPTKNEEIHTQLSVTNSAISGDDSSKGTFEPSSAIAARLKETKMTLTQRDEVASVDVSEDSGDSRPKVEPVVCSSPAVPPNSTTVEIAPSKLSTSCSNVVSSERDLTLDSTVNKKQPSEEVDSSDCGFTFEGGVGVVKDGGAQFARGHEMMDLTCESGMDLPTVTSAPTSDGSPGDFSAGNTGKNSDMSTTETTASAQTGTEASVKEMVESSHKGTGLDSRKNVQEESTLSSQEGAPRCCTETDAVTRAEQKPSSSVNDGSNDSSFKCVAKSAGMQDPTVTTFSDASHAEGEIGVKLSKQENLNVELAIGPTKNEGIHTQLSVTNSAISGDDSSKGTFEPSSAIAARLKETNMTLTQRDEVASVDVSEDSSDSRPKVEPVLCSSPAVPPNSTTVEIAPSKLPSSCSNVVSSERDPTLDSTVNKKQPSEEVDSSDRGFTTEGGVGLVKDGGAQFARGHEMTDPTCESGTDLPTVTSAPTSDGSPGDFSAGNTGKTSDVATTESTTSAQTGTEASVKEMVESSHKDTGLDSPKNVQEESTLSSQEGAPRCCTETDAVTRAEQKPSSSVNDGSNDSSLKCVAKSAGMQDSTVTTFSDASHAEGEIGVNLSKQENLNVELAIGPTKNEGIHTQLSVTNSAISGDDSSKGTFEPSSAIAARLKETNMTLTQRDEVASVDVSEDSSDSRPKVEPVLCSSPAVPPNSTTVEIAPSKLPTSCSSCSNVVSSERDPTLDSTVNKKQPSEEVDSSDRGFTTEGGVGLENGEVSSTVSTEAGTGTDMEGGHGVTAGSLDSPGCMEPGSDREDFDEEIELHPRLYRAHLDDDSGINNSTHGLEDELEDGLDEEDDDGDCLKGERQQGDGEESVDPSDLQDKVLDFDEDKRNPQYIPKKGAFYQHDVRMVGDEDSSEVPEEKNDDDKGSRRPKKLWHDEGVWGHDMYREEEQGPKSSEELVSIYGYDIRSEQMPPRARRRRRYGRGPNKYERSWEDEEAYTPRSGSGRGGGARGGRRTRGGSLVENPQFHDEDFPDLHSKPSENTATLQQNSAEVKPSARPAGFKGSDLTGSNSSQQEQWDNTVKGSGMTHRGRGKRPSQHSRAVPDAPSRQQDCDVKEDASLGHRVGRPAPQSPVKAVEAPQVSPAAGRSRAIRHLLTEQEQSKREYEALKKFAAKGELQDGDNTDLKRSTATTVTPRGGPVGSSECAAKPRRYSSLRQRPLAEAVPYTETAVVSPQLPNTPAPLPMPNQPQPAILTSAHFQAPYAPYSDGYMLPPPGQAPTVMPTQNQPPPVMAAPSPLSSSYLPPPTGIVSFPAQYPPPYSFPAQYAAPASTGAPAPTPTQAQKPPYYHGDITYYNTQSQQHKRPSPPRRPKVAIPIVPPPESQGISQESAPEPVGVTSHRSKSDEDLDNKFVGSEQAFRGGPTAQQAVEKL